LGGVTLAFAAGGPRFLSTTLTALDGKSIAGSQRVLLTAVGRVEGTGMVWKTAEKTSVGRNWGTGPTLIEVPTMEVTVSTDGARRVWALDGNGRRKQSVPATFQNGLLRFSVAPAQATMWWEIAR
jgi:hypothetical protein